MPPLTRAAAAELGAERVSDLLWRRLEALVAELNAVLRTHLRELPLVAFRGRGSTGGGALVVGRSRLELAFDVDDDAPAVLGAVARVLRLSAVAAPSGHVVAVLWLDPTRLRWTSTETEGEVFALDDRAPLERFFLALFLDRA